MKEWYKLGDKCGNDGWDWKDFRAASSTKSSTQYDIKMVRRFDGRDFLLFSQTNKAIKDVSSCVSESLNLLMLKLYETCLNYT